MGLNEMIILSNEDFYCKSLKIGISVDDIISEFNCYDWIELNEKPIEEIYLDFKKRLKFKNPKGKYQSIREKSFAYYFQRAVINLSALIEEVNSSYNIPSAGGVSNQNINKYYYLKYWADKKAIAVNYNENNYNRKSLFNLYSILLDILATKLENFNSYNSQKK